MCGQTVHLKVLGATATQTKVIDSIGYKNVFIEPKLLPVELNLLAEKLHKAGYIECEITENKKLNDSTLQYSYSLGTKISLMQIYITDEQKALLNERSNTITIPFTTTEDFLNNVVKKMEQNGYPLAKVFLSDFEKKKNTLLANLTIATEKKRAITEIVFKGYEKFPEGFKKNLNRMFRKKPFTKSTSNLIYKNLNALQFVKQTKYPEVLFTQDSTKVFVYTEKAKANSLDALIGFGNDDGKKIIFSGYLDASLLNVLNSGEKMTLNWRSNGKSQRNFLLGFELPYIFKSPIALKTQLAIFKQDSTFQNTKTAIDLGYYFTYQSKLYLGYQATESSDIKNLNTLSLSDFNNQFLAANFEYHNTNNQDVLFPEKSNFSFAVGSGKRSSKFQENRQFFGSLFLKHLFYFNNRNILQVKAQNYYLQSSEYIVNELYRFGGINSVRGFTENSLQGNFFSAVFTEYCYVLSPTMYAHTIIDYGYFQDKTTNLNGNLLGLGLGFAILTKNGLLNLVYANGSTNNQAIKLSNSVVQISLKARF